MAACYVFAHGRDAALERARANIPKYNEALGGKNSANSGYHETLTVFWIDRVVETMPKSGSRVDAVRHVVDALAAKRDLWREYYSFDVVQSTEARARHVPPDLTFGEARLAQDAPAIRLSVMAVLHDPTDRT